MPFLYRTRNLVPDVDTARERAAAGAAYLDARFGPVWVDHIRVDRLKIASFTRCVIAQLARAQLASVILPPHPIRYGFTCGVFHELAYALGARPRVLRESYARLDAAWKELVLARRAGLSEPRRADAAANEPARPAVAC